jgi:hypothetical protein
LLNSSKVRVNVFGFRGLRESSELKRIARGEGWLGGGGRRLGGWRKWGEAAVPPATGKWGKAVGQDSR